MASLDSSEEDKKTLLRAKMVEERWRIPAVMNEVCKFGVGNAMKTIDKKGMDDGENSLVRIEEETQRTFSMPMASQTAFER